MNKPKDHDDWSLDFSVSDLGLVTCRYFKEEWLAFKKQSKKSEGNPDAACVDELVERMLVTRRITVREVHALRVAFDGVIKGRSSKGVGKFKDALDALDALDGAVERKGSPLAIMFVIARITDEEHWEDWYKKRGEPASISPAREKRLLAQGDELTGAVKILHDKAEEAFEAARSCSEASRLDRRYLGVGLALTAVERSYAEVACEAQWTSRFETSACGDVFSQRFTMIGSYVEHTRYLYDRILLGDCCEDRTEDALASLVKWSSGFEAEVRAYAGTHACGFVGDLPKLTTALDTSIKAFAAHIGQGGSANARYIRLLDRVHERNALVGQCVDDRKIEHFRNEVQRGFVHINLMRIALSGCGCEDGWPEARRALDQIVEKGVIAWGAYSEYARQNEDERQVPPTDIIVDVLCTLLPAFHTVWCAITESWHQSTCSHGHPYAPAPGARSRPGIPDPADKLPDPSIGTGRAQLRAFDPDEIEVTTPKPGETVKKDLAIFQSLRDPGTLGIPPEQAAAARVLIAQRLRAEQDVAQLLKTGTVGRSIRNVLPGRHYVELPTAEPAGAEPVMPYGIPGVSEES